MKRPVCKKVIRVETYTVKWIIKGSAGHMKDFALYFEHPSKSRLAWREDRVVVRCQLGGFCCATVDGGSKQTGTLQMKQCGWI